MLEWCNFSQPSPQMMAVFFVNHTRRMIYFLLENYMYAKKLLFLYIKQIYV